LNRARPRLEQRFGKSLARAIAFAAAIGLAGCGTANYNGALSRAGAVESYAHRETETPGSLARLDPEKIKFSQAIYSISGKTEDRSSMYTVEDNVHWLREHPGQELPWGGPILVFRKQAFMDEWGPLVRNLLTGDPRNLENGEIYTLDHRRLVAYRRARRKTIPVQWADLRVVRDQRWRFTTTNRGHSISEVP
jgi:hypothetical protein